MPTHKMPKRYVMNELFEVVMYSDYVALAAELKTLRESHRELVRGMNAAMDIFERLPSVRGEAWQLEFDPILEAARKVWL